MSILQQQFVQDSRRKEVQNEKDKGRDRARLLELNEQLQLMAGRREGSVASSGGAGEWGRCVVFPRASVSLSLSLLPRPPLPSPPSTYPPAPSLCPLVCLFPLQGSAVLSLPPRTYPPGNTKNVSAKPSDTHKQEQIACCVTDGRSNTGSPILTSRSR